MSLPVPTWRCFQNIFSDAEASSFSESCLFSLATLEVACDSETTSFALTEEERPGAWRWAIISDRRVILHAGSEPSRLEAKKIATEALHRDSPVATAMAMPL